MVKIITTTDFINDAVKVHGEKYDYSKTIYVKMKQDVIIICKIHGEYEQKPDKHKRGAGCQMCSGVAKITIDEFIRRAAIKHGTKYDYSKVKFNTIRNNAIIGCNIHGDFTQRISHHMEGSECPNCSLFKKKSNTKDFILKAAAVHGNKYDYSKVKYINNRNKVIIICSNHGDFVQLPSKHLMGRGCQDCGHGKYDSEEFIRRANIVHSNKYDYTGINYTNAIDKICIRCHSHGGFYQTPSNHLTGNGCPKCSKIGYSKSQIVWLNFMEIYHNITIQHMGNSTQEYRIGDTKWKADGYCEETNTVWEYHGDFYHGSPQVYDPEFINPVIKKTMGYLYEKTIKREQKIRDLGYNLVIMWENDWKKINKAIKHFQQSFKSSWNVLK